MWFHVSYTWTDEIIIVHPRTTPRPDTDTALDKIPCIHVCPTPRQCLIAFAEWMYIGSLNLYMTEADATPAPWVFDYSLTEEHRIYVPTTFKLVKTIDCDKLLLDGVPHLPMAGISDEQIIRNGGKMLAIMAKLGL